MGTNPDEVNELVEDAAKMEAIWPKLSAFQQFAKDYGAPELSAASPFWRAERSTPLGAVTLVGLNTSLLSLDDKDGPQTLALGLGQIHKALKEPARDALLFVLQHHPPEWLRDGDQLRASLQHQPHLLLYGHVHEQRGFVRLPFMSRGAIELVAGAGHQDAKEAGEHAYAWGRLHAGGLDYFSRAWLQRDQTFLAQRMNPPTERRTAKRSLEAAEGRDLG